MDSVLRVPGTDTLDATTLRQQLTTATFGHTVHLFASTTSTNDIAKTLAQQGAPEGTIVLADHQTQGRGRQGRTFASPGGVGIYLSLILRPGSDPQRLPPLTLATAVATAEALIAYSGLPIRLKWPNDVLIHDKKVAGILCEAVLSAAASPLIIVGIGINVNTALADFPPDLHTQVTSLALAAGHHWPRQPLVALLLAQLEQIYRVFQQPDMATIRQRWLHYGQVIGRQVQYTHATAPVVATVVDLDADGALLVQHDDGLQHRLVAGEVVFL